MPLLIVGYESFYKVDETEQVIVTQFGKPVGGIINEAGLRLKTPFIQAVNRIEKRILLWDDSPNDMLTKDKIYITVDTFGRWKIKDPLQYFLRLRNERSAQSHGSSKLMPFPIDRYENFVNVERITIAPVIPSQWTCVNSAEFDAPEPDSLTTNNDPALGQ